VTVAANGVYDRAMSEPFSLIMDLPIAPGVLRRALARPTQASTAYDDWAELGFGIEPEYLERADITQGWTPGRYLSDMRDYAREELGWTFQYDPQQQRLLCIILLWSENVAEIIGGLAVLRSFGEAVRADAGQPGYILVHDFIFNARETGCAVILQGGASRLYPGTSRLVPPMVTAIAPTIVTMVEQADDVFEGALAHDPDRLLIDHFPEFV